MTDAPLIVFGGICLIAFGVVAFMVFRAVFQEIGSMRGDIKGITQALALMSENQGHIIHALQLSTEAQAGHRGEGSVQ